MRFYTIGDNKTIIYGGDVDDGVNDISKYWVKKSSGAYREFDNTDSHCDYECFNASKVGTLNTFSSLEEAKAFIEK